MLFGMRKLPLTAQELEARERERKEIYGGRRKEPIRKLDPAQKYHARVRQNEYGDRQRSLRRPDSRILARTLLAALSKSSRAELKAAAAVIARFERLLVVAGYDLEQSRDRLRKLQLRLKRS